MTAERTEIFIKRRSFILTAARAVTGLFAVSVPGLATALSGCRPLVPLGGDATRLDALTFGRLRRYVRTPFGRVAYVERGGGPAALFIHGYPLNGFQWRGALERLAPSRRCIAPDLLGHGYTETNAEDLSPIAQMRMLLALLDSLGVDAADIVANDSGLTIAQLMAAHHPRRVRTLLLTNGDVHTNSPPAGLAPFLELARAGVAADQWLAPQLADPEVARSAKGLGGGAYTEPANLTDECIQYYFAPLLATPLRKHQFHRYALGFEPNPLPAIAPALKRSPAPARMVWGTGDRLFPVQWAEWLDRTLPKSRGVRLVPNAKLFFPEEMPDLIAEEARALWNVG